MRCYRNRKRHHTGATGLCLALVLWPAVSCVHAKVPYLKSSFVVCRNLLAKATVAFQVCSETVNSVETSLRDMHCLDMADMLRILQLNEKEKLRLTLILQALRQSYSKGFSWQDSSPSVTAALPAAAEADRHECHCCTAAEPTQEEFTAAKTEALQGLQIAIDNINEVLEELKYAEAEYSELSSS